MQNTPLDAGLKGGVLAGNFQAQSPSMKTTFYRVTSPWRHRSQEILRAKQSIGLYNANIDDVCEPIVTYPDSEHDDV